MKKIKGNNTKKIKRKMKINHLRNYYSDYTFSFLKKYVDELSIDFKVGDIGAGHLRNLKLFEELDFNNLYALDREYTDNPLKVNLKSFILQDIEEGIDFSDRFFDITLCNFVLMFINQRNQSFVLDELMRVSNNFLIIETYPKKYKPKNTFHKDYNFQDIVEYISKNEDFEILEAGNYYERLLVRRVR